MSFTEQFQQLSQSDQEKLIAALEPYGMTVESVEDLLSLKIVLEGKHFDATIPSDLAHSLWKLQLAYYRMVGAVLHESPSAVLNAEEKEQYKLVFKIKSGSTDGVADIWKSSQTLMEKALDKMEPWQILVAIAILAGAYLGVKWFDRLNEKQRIEADVEKTTTQNETVQKMLETHREIFEAASYAGREGRVSIIKGVSGIERAQIGGLEYDRERIDQIKRRATRVKASSDTLQMQVTVEEIDTRDKSNPTVYLRKKGEDGAFKASLAIQGEDDEDVSAALDIIWDAARYPDRFFWAEVSVSSKKGKILSATVTAVAQQKEDLPDTSEESADL